MAAFTSNFAIYSPNGVNPIIQSGDGNTFNSVDTNGDGAYDVGDALQNGPGPFGDFTYEGTVEVEGNTYLQFVNSNGATLLTATAVVSADFPSNYDGNASLNTDPFVICFLEGTEISTPDGVAKVEDLKTGDMILTADGETVAVKWLGKQTVSTMFAAAERLMPVRFAAGSLGNDLPNADLTVTADHAMLVDGVLCNAGALVNGTTIARVPLAEFGKSFTVYHVETELHDIILANGAASETFIDNVSRRVFDNFAEYEAMYGDEAEMAELPLPRATSARQVPASIKARLASKAVA